MINVNGLSIEDILAMDPNEINSLNESDLKAITRRLVSASNKRIRRLAKTEIGRLSPAYEKQNVQFSVRGLNRNETLHELARMRNFLQKKTSTARGWKDVLNEMEKRIGGKLTPDQLKKFWEEYRKIEEANGGLIGKESTFGSTEVQTMLYSEIREDEDTAINKVMDRLTALYEERESSYNDLLEAFEDDDYEIDL